MPMSAAAKPDEKAAEVADKEKPVENIDALEVRYPGTPPRPPTPPPTPICPMTMQEDDEFEEFEQQEWTAAEQDADDTTMWQDGWEDDEEDDQFTKQLRAELAKTDGAAPAPMQS